MQLLLALTMILQAAQQEQSFTWTKVDVVIAFFIGFACSFLMCVVFWYFGWRRYSH